MTDDALLSGVYTARRDLRDRRKEADEARDVYRRAVEAEQESHRRYMDALLAIEQTAAALADDLPPVSVSSSTPDVKP